MRNENFILINAWMVTKLKLKGNELILYALIYGFSQDGQSQFSGSIKYICDWLGCTKNTAKKAINGLLEKEYIFKDTIEQNNLTFNKYKVNYEIVKSCLGGSEIDLVGGQKLTQRGSEIDPNNIYINIKKIYKDIVNKYTSNLELSKVLCSYIDMREKMRGFTDMALKLNLNSLDKLSSDEDTKIKIVEQSIANSWKAFYPLKKKQNVKSGDQNDNTYFL